MSIRVNITDNSKKFIDAKNAAVEAAMEKIGMAAEGFAKLELMASDAVDTGRLRNSITYSTEGKPANLPYSWGDSTKGRNATPGSDFTKSNGGEEVGAVYLGTNVEYAEHIEFGTSRMQARPYLRPAFNDHMNEYKGIVLNKLKDV